MSNCFGNGHSTSKSTTSEIAPVSQKFDEILKLCHLFLDFKIPQRWVTVCLGFFGLLNAFAMRVCLSIAITEMTVPHDHTGINNSDYSDDIRRILNNTHLKLFNHLDATRYDWNEQTQGLILSSFYWGYIFSCILGGVICQKFGGKHTLGFGVLFTSLFTILTPYSVYWGGSTALIIWRSAIGFGDGTTFPAVTHLLAHWIPKDERSVAGSVVFSGMPAGTIFGMFISGIILQNSKSGWPMVFFFYGTVGIVFFLFNTAFCYNHPHENRYISDEELTYLRNKLDNAQKNLPTTPWFYMLKSPAVWAAVIAKFGFTWGYVTIISDMPKYMSSVLKFSAQDNGYFSSIPYLAMWMCSYFASWIADKVIAEETFSVTIVRKIGCIVALFGLAIFLIVASYAGKDGLVVVALQSIGVAFLGCIFCSVFINALDLSPNYASSIMGLGNGIAVIAGVISPYVVGVMTPNQTINEWRLVFWIVGAISITSGVVFLTYGSGKVQKWNDPAFLNEGKIVNIDDVNSGVEILPLNKA